MGRTTLTPTYRESIRSLICALALLPDDTLGSIMIDPWGRLMDAFNETALCVRNGTEAGRLLDEIRAGGDPWIDAGLVSRVDPASAKLADNIRTAGPGEDAGVV